MGYLTLRNIWISLLLVTQSYFTACDTSPKQARVEVVNKGYRYTKNGFLESIKRSDHSSTALFILAGMNPNSISSGYSALEHAASDSISLPMLLRAGADPNTTGGVTTPLIEAIKNGFIKVNEKKITSLCVHRDNKMNKTIGLIHIHHILDANIE